VLAGIPPIVTPKDKRQILVKRIALAVGSLAVIAGVIIVFHFFVMDLDIFWAKLMRRLAI
jgi:hypothetical protein